MGTKKRNWKAVTAILKVEGQNHASTTISGTSGTTIDAKSDQNQQASLVGSVGSMVLPLIGWYWVRILVGLALHLISPHPCVCKL